MSAPQLHRGPARPAMIVLLTLAAVLFAGLSALWLLVAIALWCGCAADTVRTFVRNWRNR